MNITHRLRASLLVAFPLAIAASACSGAAAPPQSAAPSPTTAPATTASASTAGAPASSAAPDTTADAGSADTDASPETTAAPAASPALAAGVPEGKDTILTPAPSGPADSATFAVYRETATIDPLYVFDYPDNTAMAIACESLLRQNPDLTIGPGLATSVEYRTPTSLVITLRDGVTFWDGSPMTAADVVFSLERQRDPAGGGFYGALFTNVTAIAATGPLEVTITTKLEDNRLLGEFSGPAGAVVQQKFVEGLEPGTFGTAAGGAMCTGPYELTSWVVGEGLTFTRYEGYWDDSLPLQLAKLTIKGVPDETVVTSGLLTGEISGYYPLILSTLDQLRASDQVTVAEGPSYGISAFIVSNFDGALGDKRVRQALSLAIDRQGLVDALYKGAAYPARALAVPGTWGYARETFTEAWNALPDTSAPNLEEAKRLVEEAGATGATVRVGMSSELAAILVQSGEFQRALESIGLKVELVSKSAAEYISFFIDPAARAAVDGFFTVNYPNYPDPLGLYGQLVAPDGVQAFNGYADPAAQDLLARASAESDPEKRAAIVVELQTLITDETLWIPIVATTQPLVLNKSLTGAPATFQYMFGPWAAYLGAA